MNYRVDFTLMEQKWLLLFSKLIESKFDQKVKNFLLTVLINSHA